MRFPLLLAGALLLYDIESINNLITQFDRLPIKWVKGANSINNSASLFVLSVRMPRLSKNQKKILEILQVKPEMTTKEIAETVFGKLVEYRSKEYSSIHRSLMALEKKGLIQRVFVQLKWRRKIQTM